MINAPTIGADTIRFIATLTALKKAISKLNLEYENQVSISLINNFKKEIQKASNQVKKKDFDLEVVKISKDKSLLGYMLIKKNHKSITTSKAQKRSKNYKREVIFTGLNQPNKKPHRDHIKASYDVIKSIVKRFTVYSFDLSIDTINDIVISSRTKHILDKLFHNFINHRSNTQIIDSSYYVNNPISLNNPRFDLVRVLLYDKTKKESLKDGKLIKWDDLQNLPDNWKRLELTFEVSNHKLSISLLDEVMESIYNLDFNLFSDSCYDDTLLQKQKDLLELRG